MVDLRSNEITSMRLALGSLNKGLNGLEGALGGGVTGIEKDITDLYGALRKQLSSLYFALWPSESTEADKRMYSVESKADLDRIIKEWCVVHRIVDPIVKEDWSCKGAKMQPHLIWTKVGFIKAKYYLNNLSASLGLGGEANSSRNEVDANASIKKGYLSELWDMERGMATPPKTISKTSQLIQTVFEIEPTEVEVTCDLGKDELRDATEMIEKANAEIEKLKLEKVERLKAEGEWADAEQTYRQVIELKHAGRGRGDVDDAVVLELGYQMAEMQRKQKKYSDAEATARDIWEKRKHLPGEDDSEATRSSRLQLCQALRGQGVEKKFKEATTMYRGIWCYSTDKYWMMENGHELGLVLAEQGRFKEASVQHEKVWLERKDVLEPGATDTVLSLHEWLRILEIQEKPETTSTEKEDPKLIILQKEKVLRLIWEAHGGPAEGFFDIPARGHELGSVLFRQERFNEAAPILNDVWEARKALLEVSAVTLLTGDLLAKAQNSRGRLEEAARVYRWICNAREQIPSEDSRLLDSRQRLGHILFQRRLFDESAAECRKVWEPARHNAETSPLTVPETVLKAGLDLALSLEQLENFEEEAYQTIELVCKCKRRQLQPQPIPSTFSEALDRIQQRRQAIMPPPLRRQSRPSTPRASSTPRQERARTSQRRPGRQERCDSHERKPRKKNIFGF